MKIQFVPLVFLTKITGLMMFLLGICLPVLAQSQPSIEDYATIEAYVGKDEVPVYAFGYTYVYGLSPDLLPGVVMQEGNPNPAVKFKPKKSWEIQSNLCGLTPTREPLTMWNDDQPLLPIHLIDGDPETAWCSSLEGIAGLKQSDFTVWIRIDLPVKTMVASVALVCSENGPFRKGGISPLDGSKLGKSLPRELIIKLSCDGQQWEPVYENKDFSGPDAGPTIVEFTPRPAKQIWIIGSDLPQVFSFGNAFSIGEAEVRDPAGNNLALVSRGAGVQVSSTFYGIGDNRFGLDMMWPLHYDLGFKWLRVGYDLGMYLWSYVEREKGKLTIDPQADAVITEAHRNGVNVILCLDKGNWLYHDLPRKTDWKKNRVREMMFTYCDHPGWPHDSEKMMEGWLRYVDYMVRHFKGRVAYYEILNEWNHGPTAEEYVEIVSATIPVIKNADPEAKVMLGSPSGFDRERLLACLGKESVDPSIAIRNGKMFVPGYANRIYTPGGPGYTLLLADNITTTDANVCVDARSESEAGILLRYQDRSNYLLAMYQDDNGHKSIYIQEIVDGHPGPRLSPAGVIDFGEIIHLSAEVQGSQAAITVTDGKQSVSTKDTIASITNAGGIGLFHDGIPPQTFDNFEAVGTDGGALYKDAFDGPNGSAQGWTVISLNYPKIEPGLASQIDAIGWHPYLDDPEGPEYKNMRKDVIQFKKECEALGFKGRYGATEWAWYTPATRNLPGPAPTEMQNAKYSAQFMVINCGLDLISLFNETARNLRGGFQSDPVKPRQPSAVYYVLRNISTVLDGFAPADFPVTFSGGKPFECYTFTRGGNERLLAAWIPGKTSDGIVETHSDVYLPDISIRTAWVIDIFNGTEQELAVTRNGDDSILKGMFIKDYPVFMRISQ